jgi:hypothetical protein
MINRSDLLAAASLVQMKGCIDFFHEHFAIMFWTYSTNIQFNNCYSRPHMDLNKNHLRILLPPKYCNMYEV